MPMLTKDELRFLYEGRGSSVMEVAAEVGCSANAITYWMNKYGIKRRTIAEAIYQKHNPDGDPFTLKPVRTMADAKLLGMAIGLYWGEGTKSNKYAVRLGNTDPELLKTFIRFLIELCQVQKSDLHFGLQIFTDIDPQEALAFWTQQLDVEPSQFYKITVTISGSIGTYRQKSKYGVLTVYYHNKKLRDVIVGMCRDSSVGRAFAW